MHLGQKTSEETKTKQSQGLRLFFQTEKGKEERKKLAKTMKETRLRWKSLPPTDETCKKISQSLTGRKWSEENKKKLSASMKLWYIEHPEEAQQRCEKSRLMLQSRKRELNPRWKGDNIRWVDRDGYVRVRLPVDYPFLWKDTAIPEHRLVWEQAHNKPLPRGWVIHHINGNRADNRIENLMALPDRKHKHLISYQARKIQELEKRVTLLEADLTLLRQTLEKHQAIFYIGR